MNQGHLNDIHVCSLEDVCSLEVGQFCSINTCRIGIKLKGRRDTSIDLWLCAFILGGRSSQASIIPVVQYLPYGSTANFRVRAPADSLQKQEENGTVTTAISVV